jgi:hypothetical protein
MATPLRNLPKHEKYASAYKPNDLFWGLGVEHETYLESKHIFQVKREDLRSKRIPERYSHDYYEVYKPDILNGLFDLLPAEVPVPLLINSHSFQSVDLKGYHITTYENNPKPNPKFSGETLIEYLKRVHPTYFKGEHERAYIFDGDTVEFVSQDFYNATVDKVIAELDLAEKTFEKELATGLQDASNTWFGRNGPFKIASCNWPYASYLTNRNNYAMFNNGTIHINITLPTVLDASGRPCDMDEFTGQHKAFIRAIQWLEPFFVAMYGSPDPWSKVSPRFAKGSQRLAVSRYIGIGTYDTDKMPLGKILTVAKKDLAHLEWMDEFYSKTDYVPLASVGLDINFYKHYSHGVELRIFDALPLIDVEAILRVLVNLADHSLSYTFIRDPRKSSIWQGLVVKCLLQGKDAIITYDEQVVLDNVFGLNYPINGDLPVSEVYRCIVEWLAEQYVGGMCADCFFRGIVPKKGLFGLMAAEAAEPAAPVTPGAPANEIVLPRAAPEAMPKEEAKALPEVVPKEEPKPTNQVPIVSLPTKGWSCILMCRS